MQKFTSDKNISHSSTTAESNIRNLNVSNNNAFDQLCEWLVKSEQQDKQHTIHDLKCQMSTYLPPGIEAYTNTHLKRRLLEHFGDFVTISEVEGKSNVLTFNVKASTILHDTFLESAEWQHDDADINLIKDAAYITKREIRESEHVNDIYPPPTDITIDRLEKMVPNSLLTIINGMVEEPRSESARIKKRLSVVSVCLVIMQMVGQKSFISHLLLATGVYMHQSTRSRVLLDVLSSLCLSPSYYQVMAFERSAAVSRSPEFTQKDNEGGFCQWVAYNFDYNEDSLTGQNSTHVMGIITCQTPRSTDEQVSVIKRTSVSTAEIVCAGDFSDIIRSYKPPLKSLMSEVRFERITPEHVDIHRFQCLDTLWLISSYLSLNPPNWQGFMSNLTTGHCLTTSVIFNPMVPLNPQTDEAVYSTMTFVCDQALSAGICCAVVTFDQPLFLKAYRLKTDKPHEFKSLFIRLGGFHQLMSFLGAGCKLMEGSGLEDAWATVYARKSLPKIMEGKAYTKTLRACLLTDAALHVVMMQPIFPLMTNNEDHKSEDEDNTSLIKDVNYDTAVETSDMPAQQDMSQSNKQAHNDNDELCSKLKDLYTKLLHCDQEIDTHSEDVLQELSKMVDQMTSKYQNVRTAQLWLMFMRFVSTVRMFIRAERTGNWPLHIKATHDMLPIFAAAGHNNYTKCCRLYLQDCQAMCSCLTKAFMNGLFTVRRNENLFLCGTWTDMIIEQSLMRSGKQAGGLINITHKEAAKTKWLLSAHIVAQYTDAIRTLTDTYTGTWSEQHREMQAGRISIDYDDLNKLIAFMRSHNPFINDDDSQLRNIATGVIADERVNADDAINIGTKIHEQITDMKFSDVVLKKSNQATTFAVMRKSLKLENGKDICMSSAELYQRLLSIAYASGLPDRSVFAYELTTVSPALFHDNGKMRKTQKSLLAQHITKMDPTIVCTDMTVRAAIVVDGCAILHRISWPKVGTLQTVCSSYLSFVSHLVSPDMSVCVVFDSYVGSTTKEPEQKRRRLHQERSADVIVKSGTPVPADKVSFLSNNRNKQQFIDLLASYLVKGGVAVEHAGDEGDADIVIVRKAIAFSNIHTTVKVISDDTDVLILLLYHVSCMTDFFMQTKQQCISINAAKNVLGHEICACLPFLHAMSGCDTTSAIFGIGKLKLLKTLQSSEQLRRIVSVFGDNNSSKAVITAAGEQFMLSLYSGGNKVSTLDELRYLNVISTKYVPVQRMPPTSRVCFYHSLRVHLQVNTWVGLRTILDKEDYGFKVSDGSVIPVITDKDAAPSNLLRDIICSCKTSLNLCTSCNCCKKGIRCSIHCGCGGECQNGMVGGQTEHGDLNCDDDDQDDDED